MKPLIAASMILLAAAGVLAQSGHAHNPAIVFTTLRVGFEGEQVVVRYAIDATSWQRHADYHPTLWAEISRPRGRVTQAHVRLEQNGFFNLPTEAGSRIRIEVKTGAGQVLGIQIADQAGPMTVLETHTDWLHPIAATPRPSVSMAP